MVTMHQIMVAGSSFHPLAQLQRLTSEFLIDNRSAEQRKACGYIKPIIDYSFARQRVLDIYATAMGKVE